MEKKLFLKIQNVIKVKVNYQTKIKQLFEVRYSPPREGILTILIDIIQTLNFCG